jgi:serine/threonine protein kinase
MFPGRPIGQAAGLPLIGQTLGGKYEIVRLLGEGGMAFVFEASHRRLHQRVAIKLLAPEFVSDAELVARFEREGRAVARLRTKHVVRVMDVDATPEGLPYMVMEFLEGRDLDAELQARTQLPLGESVDIILQACAAMIEAHGMGIVHRDLKPANLFLAKEREGSDRVVKVLDFGISKVFGEATRLTTAGAVMGTVLYMSPEQVRAESNVDMRADIWSLGVILFELLAGRAPFEGSSPQIAAKIVSADPPDLRTFATVPEGAALAVRRMLERDRDRRFASVAEVVAALAPFTTLGSIGSGIAEKLALSGSGSRGWAASPAGKHTVPMPGTPGFVARSSASAARRSAPAPQPPTPASRHAVTAPVARTGSRARPVLFLAMGVGLLGAAGAVLILVAISRRPKPMSIPDVAPVVVSAQTSAAPPAHAAESAEIVAAPPSTGTTGRSSTASATSGRTPIAPASSSKKDGGGARPTLTSTAADGIPPVL